MVETATGKEGDEDISLYHTKTKSRTMRISSSFMSPETEGKLGLNGGSDWGDLYDHCERVIRACQAAGEENASGRAMRLRLWLGILVCRLSNK